MRQSPRPQEETQSKFPSSPSSPSFTRLVKLSLQRRRGRHIPSTTPRWITTEHAICGALLASVVAVQEHIVGHADVAAAALEHAGVHIGRACRAVDDHSMAVHVDLTAHIDHTGRRERKLAPCVADLTVHARGVGVDCRPRTGQAGRERDGLAGAGSQAQGDQGRRNVDPTALRTPNNHNNRLASIVGEGIGVGTVGTNPSRRPRSDGVCAREAGRGFQEGGIGRGEQITLGNTTMLALAEDLYRWGILCDVHFHRGWLSRLLGVKVLMAMFEGDGDSLAGKEGG